MICLWREKMPLPKLIASSSALGELYELVPDGLPQPANEQPASEPKHAEEPWPTMHEKAFTGLVGEIVDVIKPETESDPVAILLQFHICFGNVIGRNAYYRVEDTSHHANLFGCLVGASSRARKGTSEKRVRAIFEDIDPVWNEQRIKGGLSSGEGFVYEVRDEIRKWNAKDKCFEVIEPAVGDKRLLVIEPEFSSVLAVKDRHGNTLSHNIRHAYDGLTLGSMTKASPVRATGAHVSIIGHITEAELRANLTRTDTANGFANRILFACVKRSQILPFGGQPIKEKMFPLVGRLREAVNEAKKIGLMSMDGEAREFWDEAYRQLSADQPGLLGAITARAEAHTLRLAMVYALEDAKGVITKPHIEAAIAVWDYCEASAARIFGSMLGDDVADEILIALRQAGSEGLTRTAIRDLFGRNRSADRIGAALGLLLSKGRAKGEMKDNVSGRPTEVWRAING